jgi:hypothetical protein
VGCKHHACDLYTLSLSLSLLGRQHNFSRIKCSRHRLRYISMLISRLNDDHSMFIEILARQITVLYD